MARRKKNEETTEAETPSVDEAAPEATEPQADPTAEEVVEAGFTPDEDLEPIVPPRAQLPEVPTKDELIHYGLDEAKADIIIFHMQAIHDEVAALDVEPKNFVRKSAFRIMPAGGKKAFWVCGKNVSTTHPWEVPIDTLTQQQLEEIEIVKNGEHITVEEIELEVEE